MEFTQLRVTSFLQFSILTQSFLPINRRSNASADSALLPEKELAEVKVGGGAEEGEREKAETVRALKNDRGREDPEERQRDASQSGYNHSG